MQLVHLSQPLVIASLLLTGLGFSGIWPLIVSQAGIIFANKYTGTSFGLVVAAGGIGSMMIPYLLGLVSETTRMGLLLGLLSVFMFGIMAISTLVSVLGKAADSSNRLDSFMEKALQEQRERADGVLGHPACAG